MGYTAPMTTMHQTDALLQAHCAQHPHVANYAIMDVKTGLITARGFGQLPGGLPTAPDQVYDLASLTKVLVGAPLAMALVAEGVLKLDAPLKPWLPEQPETRTLRQLLNHTSGYPAWKPFFEGVEPKGTPEARTAILKAARNTPEAAPPGEQATYSDVGFLVLLALLEAAKEGHLEHLWEHYVRKPAQSIGLAWGHPSAAPTQRIPHRGGVIRGVVHDDNAWAMGGVSTHAGLFGSAVQVALTVASLWNLEGPVKHIAELFHRERARTDVGSHRGGWDTPTRGGYTSTGRFLSDESVGHLGYTGTSVWFDLRRGVVMVLLTNRVHPDDELPPIRTLRPTFHDAIAHDLGWTTP